LIFSLPGQGDALNEEARNGKANGNGKYPDAAHASCEIVFAPPFGWELAA